MGISVKNLTKIYGAQRAVDNISFEAKEGEILGFLGPNGAGKSTTMKIATCYIPPTSGTVEVGGYNVETDPLEVKKIVGYLPEHNPLYLDMYVHEYLEFIAGMHGLSGKQKQSRVAEMVSLVGLTREQRKKIGTLSKGYRQRIGLAQALIHDPKVLILDEPTTGLDPNQISEIRDVIKGISQQKTVMLSTHIMQEVQALCDRVIIINKGKIVTDDKTANLQQQSDQFSISVEFAGKTDHAFLKQIEGVNSVDEIGTNKYLVFASKDLRAEIFHAAVNANTIIIGLSQESISLESAFQKLTQSK
ncbi:gliding motility-associated ABC transporter ATP-binding subunit GldA [Limibacter armeniacum]|uniref:gliding motility-associated ABC transporter ATP-binding subunit GldA n=1 Tax=Limibacter armeniacum TaxID=466084 RepID=UPI002FE64EFB